MSLDHPVAGIPLIKGGEAVGVLYFNYHTPGQITEDRLRTMQLFANQAAIAIANARLFEENCTVLYPYDPSRQIFYDISSVASYGMLYKPFELSDKPRLKGGMAAFVRRERKVVINDIEPIFRQ